MSSLFVIVLVFAKVVGLTGGWITGSGAVAIWGFFGPDVILWYQLFVPNARWMCPVTRRFATKESEVWLTIDDGPDPEDTPRLLDLLDQYGMRATFFMIGERAARYPSLVEAVIARGHEIGAHTMTHPVGTFWAAGPRRTEREVAANLAVLRPEGRKVRAFRAPAGIKNLFLARVLGRHGLRCVGWSVRAFDARARRPEPVAARVLRQVRPGAIILMHEGPGMFAATRVAAIELVLRGLQERGLRSVVPSDGALGGDLGPAHEKSSELVDHGTGQKK